MLAGHGYNHYKSIWKLDSNESLNGGLALQVSFGRFGEIRIR